MKSSQLGLKLITTSGPSQQRSRNAILADVQALLEMHRSGRLGGEHMPEDVHPPLDRKSADLAHYFTLGMALNYQRNSYSLWRSCTNAWNDLNSRWIFVPNQVVMRSTDELRDSLVLHRVALQPNNHTKIWSTISSSLTRMYHGDIRQLFIADDGRISSIKATIQSHRKLFPYLAGSKICNYWLYVMLTYTDNGLRDKAALSVAPDTHVINASARLGVIDVEQIQSPSIRESVAERWATLLDGTGLDPIDVHTPLWLWSRSGFTPIERLSHK